MSARSPFLAFLLLSTLAGCGGGSGGGSSSAAPVTPQVAIAWPARARAVGAPVGATRASVTLSRGMADVSDTFERPAGAAGATQTYTIPQLLAPGVYLLTVDFLTEDNSGTLLATAAAAVRVQRDGTLVRSDGSPLTNVSLDSQVVSYSVPTSQSLEAGETKDLGVQANTKDGGIVALPPGTATFSVVAGAGALRANPDGTVTGLTEGTARVTATVAGQTTEPAYVDVRPAPVTARVVSVATGDLVADPARGKLWVSLAPSASNGNSVAALDPATGALGEPIFVGADPTALALSDDGSALYVGLRGVGAVRRVDLATNTAGLQFSLPPSVPFNRSVYPIDLAVQPGNPSTVAVTSAGFDSGGTYGPAIFDDGVPRPNALGTYEGTRLVWTASDRLVSANVGFSPSTLYAARVDASGATKTAQVQTGGGSSLVRAGGRLYLSGGTVYDETTLARVGTFVLDGTPGFGAFYGPAVDVAANRAYFVAANDAGVRLVAYRLDTFVKVGERRVAGLTNVPTYVYTPEELGVVRVGAKGLAFRLPDRIALLDDVSGL